MKNKLINRKNIKLDLLLLCCRYCSLASKANLPNPNIKLINVPNKAPSSIPIIYTLIYTKKLGQVRHNFSKTFKLSERLERISGGTR